MTVFGTASPVLCLVTPGRGVSLHATSEQRCTALDTLVRHAVRAGIDLVQIREPDLPARVLVEVVGRAVEASRNSATRVLVNDRIDVALAAGADGVHLGTRSLPSQRVREMAPAPFILGRSIHSVEEARRVAAERAVDYLIAGTVFPSASKPDETHFLGAPGLAEIVASASIPVLAIGGVTLDNIPSIARAGASGFAAIRLFCDAMAGFCLHDIVSNARNAFDTAKGIS